MRLNIIQDSRRCEKTEPLMNELKSQGIYNYEIWPCIINPSVVESINLSHKMIIQDAKDKWLPYCAVAEDDLMFTSPNSWKFFLENMPVDFDLYLACTYLTPITNNMVCGFHLYIVAEKFYDKFLSVPDSEHVDTAMDKLKGDYKFCYPFPALQRSGWSANNKSVCNYNSILKPEDIYICPTI